VAALTLPQGFTRQPQRSTPIDYEKPISKGLVLDMSPVNGMRDTVRNIPPSTAVGSVSTSTALQGLAAVFSSSVLSFGDVELFSGAEATWQIIEIPNNLTQIGGGLVNKRASSTSLHSFSIGYNYNAGTEFTVDIGNAAGTGAAANYQFSRAGFSTTVANNLVVVIDGQAPALSRVKLFRNGVSVSRTSAPADIAFTSFANTASPLEVGRVNNATTYYAGRIFLVRAWNRALRGNEVSAVSENPYTVYQSAPLSLYNSMLSMYSLLQGAGAFSVAPSSTPLKAARVGVANNGSLSMVCPQVVTKAGRVIAGSQSAYGVTPTNAGLLTARRLLSSGGNLLLSTSVVNTLAYRRHVADPSVFSVTLNDGVISYQQYGAYTFSAMPVAFISANNSAQLLPQRKIVSDKGHYETSFGFTDVLAGRVGTMGCATYSVFNPTVNPTAYRKVVSASVSFVISGNTSIIGFVQTPSLFTLNYGRTLRVHKEIRFVEVRTESRRIAVK
jgi:hypothetical protein